MARVVWLALDPDTAAWLSEIARLSDLSEGEVAASILREVKHDDLEMEEQGRPFS